MNHRTTIFGYGLLGIALIACVFGIAKVRAKDSIPALPSESALHRAPPELPTPKAARPRALVVVLADNEGAETTDFMVPFALMKSSGAVDVKAVSTRSGPVTLMPALKIRTDLDIDSFDAQEPEGADLVIVPAMHSPDSPALIRWVQSQHAKGARIAAICEGAWVLAHAGLLEGKAATTHWYAMKNIASSFPGTRWVPDRRFVADGLVMTTSGVSASLPASLKLLEDLAGTQVARATASSLGVQDWSDRHDSASFSLSLLEKVKAAANLIAFWRHEVISIAVTPEVDDMTLALTADAWSRTYRSSVVARSDRGALRTRHGLILLTEPVESTPDLLITLSAKPPGQVLQHALEAISARYGRFSARFVRMQLEWPLLP